MKSVFRPGKLPARHYQHSHRVIAKLLKESGTPLDPVYFRCVRVFHELDHKHQPFFERSAASKMEAAHGVNHEGSPSRSNQPHGIGGSYVTKHLLIAHVLSPAVTRKDSLGKIGGEEGERTAFFINIAYGEEKFGLTAYVRRALNVRRTPSNP